MREIKFRAWIKEQNIMLRWIRNIWCTNNGEQLEWINERNSDHYDYLKNDYTNLLYGRNGDGVVLMQYTGLKDKNGKEIYEGDIANAIVVDFDHPEEIEIGKVVFKEGEWVIENKKDSYPLYYQDEVEIIGNIHENPELL